MESPPRVGTRIERAEEGRCEGGEGVEVAPSVRSDISPKYDNLNLVGGLSSYIVGFGGELAKCLSIREQGVAEAGRGKLSACDPLCPLDISPKYDKSNFVA